MLQAVAEVTESVKASNSPGNADTPYVVRKEEQNESSNSIRLTSQNGYVFYFAV